MIPRIPINRVPIKLRKPIHKNFCKCWGIQVFSIDGVPQYINGDKFTSIVHLMDFLEATPTCLPMHFTYHDESVDPLIKLCINTGIPVTVKTNQVLPSEIVQALTKIPHSGIQVSINFLDDFIRDRLEPNASDIFALREMMFLAKSWKVFTSLKVDYMPHLVPILDLFEILDLVKNHVSHVFITFPDVSDALFYDTKTQWEALKPSSTEKFKSHYVADVPTRTWKVRQGRRDEILKSLSDFLKSKKITIEVMEYKAEGMADNRVRHISSGMSDLPLGIRPFFYEKDGGFFKVTNGVEGSVCPKCEKPIFA